LEAYCVKCKAKREIQDPVAQYNAIGAPVTRGVCGVCGTKLFRTGKTPAHDEIPEADRKKRGSNRNGKLVIVESPAKARTVGRFLGKGYTVKASVGHVRDLLRSTLSVDVENDFQPKYRVPNEKRPVVKELKQLVKTAEEIYLATDPDREGEAIAWHLMEAAAIEPKLSRRVVFHEITQPAIEEAFSHPRAIDMDLVNAQQARRVLDRLVGYSLSPLLWEKVRSRLSAGRVQSVALRLLVEREREIDAFVPQEYWSIEAEFRPEGEKKATFKAKLARIDEQEAVLSDEATVKPILEDLEKAAYEISKIKRGERRRKPSAPFITSTLQQEASRRLGYTAKRTMALAQQLYEGIDVGEGGATGLITYMRTDSTNIAEMALNEARQYITQRFGNDFLPPTPPQYKTRAVSAQEAHEAIRPTSVLREPEKVKGFLSHDQYRLYQLIWQRFLASQMESAVYDTLSVEVTGKTDGRQYLFRASGSTVRFPGYLVVYEEARDEDQKTEEENVRIPAGISEGQPQRLVKLFPEQHFTQPPPRYTEASLVQVLEEYGIGRPSTYAPILSTIQARGYVVREAKRLTPTETGILVNDLLMQHFSEVIDYGFTANMENDLDQIAAGDKKWVDVIRQFYTPFSKQLEKAQAEMPETKAELEKVGRACPECGHDLVIRWGRYGKFISCSNFPECRHTEAWLEKIGVVCPDCGGDIVERKTRKGRVFYGCSNYPNCQFTSWKRPVPNPCPSCKGILVVANKRELQCLSCEETFLADVILKETSSDTA
jgi:DNA topoisomerase-1